MSGAGLIGSRHESRAKGTIMDTVTGKHLIDWGYKPARWFAVALSDANAVLAQGGGEAAVRAEIEKHVPPPVTIRERRQAGELAHCINILPEGRSEEHTSELQSLMRISYAVFCLKKKKQQK